MEWSVLYPADSPEQRMQILRGACQINKRLKRAIVPFTNPVSCTGESRLYGSRTLLASVNIV